MSVEENALHDLHRGLNEVLGPERAATLMSRLSPVSWPDLVTRSYLDEKLAGVDEKFDQKLTAMEDKLALTIEAKVATHHAALSEQLNRQTLTLVFALLSTLAMVTALLLGIG
ncbi:MAG TPA: hypothetical protein VF711_13890 [Acidimicrobiales bacterium]|jgi:hypothetical protein